LRKSSACKHCCRVSNSYWFNFFLDQTRRAVLQRRIPKIERVIVCQAHRVESSAAEQLGRACWSAECIALRGLAES